MMRYFCPAQARGFTIVESLVAITILTLVALTLVPLVVQGFSEIHIAGYRIQSVHTAQKAVDVESLRNDVSDSHTLTIEFVEGSAVHIDGEVFQEEVPVFSNLKSSITIFIPRR